MKNLNHKIALLLIIALFSQVTLFAQAPANDNCANAKLIKSDSVCTGPSRLTGETLTNATNQPYTLTTSCGYVANAIDVWYKFAAKTKYPTVTISNQHANWGGIGNVRIQMFVGTCGSFTEKACGVGPTLTPALTSPLVEGDTIYVRIHKNQTAAITTAHTFDICVTDAFTDGGRMNEVFSRTILSGPGPVPAALQYPWEIAYCSVDTTLWITEARGYKVYRMNANTGVKTVVLDLSGASGPASLPIPSDSLNVVNLGNLGSNPGGWPQGGFAGLALHPGFLDTTNNHNFVYVAYVHRFLSGSSPNGIFYRNKIVRFTYVGGYLVNPAVICDTLPGSKDHNSQRLIATSLTPGGPVYLFYGSGDMGSGQFENRMRPNRAQTVNSYEGKILRFNADTVGGLTWIPSSNPYSSTSAVYSIGIRNNQGFAYDPSTHLLYGTSHGPYSDDELNIIDSFKNYGHPLVIGYAEGNYNGSYIQGSNTGVSAGAPHPAPDNGISTCPPIGSEQGKADTLRRDSAILGGLRPPLFSAYPTPMATIQNTWLNNTGNANWYSEAWSGLDIYNNKIIPDWNRSLVASGLKWGRLIRLKLGATGRTTLPSNLDSLNTADTVTYFQSTNRYRDLAFGPNGKDVFLVMDNSSATSGPGVGNPTVPACPGCVIKYSFVGYAADASAAGLSTISKLVPVTNGTLNTCNPGTAVTIDGSNNFLWVPITGPDGNIMAEINAMGQNLGLITSSFYQTTGNTARNNGVVRYLNRNITITPANNSFAIPVKVRLYISKAEFDALVADPLGGIATIGQLKVLKNSDPCGSSFVTAATLLTPTNTALPADKVHGANGYVLQVNVSSFSSFYFAANNVTLPVDLLTFTGTLQNNSTTLLKWKTTNEINTTSFMVERSIEGQYFSPIGTVAATGTTSTEANYSFDDNDVAKQSSLNVFYRLKIFNANGTYKYSNIVKVTLQGIQSEITISPNPVATEVKANVVSSDDCDAEWQIIDFGGKIVLKNYASFKKGDNTLWINMSQLASGTYYLKVKSACIDLLSKFQKL